MPTTPSEGGGLTTESGVSLFTGEPFVVLTWSGPVRGQMTPDQARALALHIVEAADGAVSDAAVVAELGAIGVEGESAARFLLSLRQRRAGA